MTLISTSGIPGIGKKNLSLGGGIETENLPLGGRNYRIQELPVSGEGKPSEKNGPIEQRTVNDEPNEPCLPILLLPMGGKKIPDEPVPKDEPIESKGLPVSGEGRPLAVKNKPAGSRNEPSPGDGPYKNTPVNNICEPTEGKDEHEGPIRSIVSNRDEPNEKVQPDDPGFFI